MRSTVTLLLLILLSCPSFSQTKNLALHQEYTASIMDSTNVSSHNPRYAFDGDTATVWHPQAYPVQWIAVYFKNTNIVDSITFWYGQDPAGTTTQEIYTTEDSLNWTLVETIHPYHNLGVGHYTYVFTNPILNSRGIKIRTTSNPSWVQWREIEVWGKNMCTDTVINDTISYFVDDLAFMNRSPLVYLDKTDSLTALWGNCDSIINHYSRFIFNATYCTDTIHVYDTTFITIYDSIAVTDTLFIDVELTNNTPPGINTIKVYPNPASDIVIIDNGNYTEMNEYNLTIINTAGQVVFTSKITEQQFQIPVNTFGSKGTYFIHIVDPDNHIIETRKLILR